MNNQNFQYRADIDGLRAIAVSAVVLYHAFPNVFPGGFVGVDIFFVISGFLITGILRKEIADDNFSIPSFYARRIRRLFPALIVVLGVVLFAGWFTLLQNEFRQLGWHAVAGASFFSNIALWLEVGYFDIQSVLKPLLHLWSLGVEEQFYIVWPLVLFAVYRLKLSFLFIAVLLFLLSFFGGITAISKNSSAAFYLPQYRFWELILGGALTGIPCFSALRGSPSPLRLQIVRILNRASLISWLGMFFIVISVFTLDEHKPFPGYWALLPVIGTAMLISAGPKTIIAKKVLANKAMVGIGLISYPLYLWHWPIISFGWIIYGESPSELYLVILVFVSLFCAWATYRFIESPLRYSQQNRTVLMALVASMICVLAAGAFVKGGIIPERLSRASDVLSAASDDWYYPPQKQTTITGNTGKTVLFFGDSTIMQLWPRAEQLTEDSSHYNSVIFKANGGCVPILGIALKGSRHCLQFVEDGYALAASKEINTIVVGSFWLGVANNNNVYDAFNPKQKSIDLSNPETFNLILSRFEEKIVEWRRDNKEIYIVLSPPVHKIAAPRVFGGRLKIQPEFEVRNISFDQHREDTGGVNDLLRVLAEKNNVGIIDPSDLICMKGTCNFSNKEGIPYYKDIVHMRASFVRENYNLIDNLILPN